MRYIQCALCSNIYFLTEIFSEALLIITPSTAVVLTGNLTSSILNCFNYFSAECLLLYLPKTKLSSFQTLSIYLLQFWGFPSGSDGKESACNAQDLGSILGSGRSPREGNGN